MRKIIVTAAIAAVGVLGLSAGSASASCGETHGAFANVNGNYGFLGGLHGTPYYENFNRTEPGIFTVGQEPGATGYNNSTAGNCQ
jgi:hypothetical protein